jgi:hypothetical protein
MIAPRHRAGLLAAIAAALFAGGATGSGSASSASAAPVAAHAASVTPRSVVRYWMRRTHEVGSTTDFRRIGPRVTVPDGHGGTITAAIGLRHPSADGKGQLVFFFHGRKFLGWDTSHESIAIAAIHRGHGPRLRVRYVRYGPRDPYCCPSRSPVTVTYHWTGGRLIASRVPPNADGARVRLSSTQATWHHCADVGPAQSDTGIYQIRMLRISCARGRHVLSVWYHDRSAPDAGPRHWRCRVKVVSFSERRSCARGSHRIQFTLLYA